VETQTEGPEQEDVAEADPGVVPRRVRWSILAVMVLLGLSRSPYLFTHGRFWAEEGVLHFRYMYLKPFPQDILYIQTRTGYYNLFADVGTWVASNFSLLRAPLVTVWFSFGLVVTLVWVSLAWPSDLLSTARAKIAAAVLLVVGTLALTEVWVNTINAQTYLALLTVLLLFVRVDEIRRPRYAVGICLLVIAGMSGLYSVALAPLFFISALWDRKVRRWGFAAAIGGAALIQAVVFLKSRSSGTVAESKTAIPALGDVYRSVAGWQVTGLLLRQNTTTRLVGQTRHGTGNGALIIGVLAVLLFGLLGLLLWKAPKRRVTALLVGALLITEVLVLVGDLAGEAGGRYAVVPVGILTLMLIYGATTSSPPPLRWAGVAVLGLVLLVGLSQFWTERPKNLRCIDCPNWTAEVAAHEQDPEHGLQIWPYDRPKPWLLLFPAASERGVGVPTGPSVDVFGLSRPCVPGGPSPTNGDGPVAPASDSCPVQRSTPASGG
jgi:hypothetical protein